MSTPPTVSTEANDAYRAAYAEQMQLERLLAATSNATESLRAEVAQARRRTKAALNAASADAIGSKP